jgi:hypothetical protein
MVAIEASLRLEGFPSKKDTFSAQSPQAKMFLSPVCIYRLTCIALVQPISKPASEAMDEFALDPIPKITTSASISSPPASYTN